MPDAMTQTPGGRIMRKKRDPLPQNDTLVRGWKSIMKQLMFDAEPVTKREKLKQSEAIDMMIEYENQLSVPGNDAGKDVLKKMKCHLHDRYLDTIMSMTNQARMDPFIVEDETDEAPNMIDNMQKEAIGPDVTMAAANKYFENMAAPSVSSDDDL